MALSKELIKEIEQATAKYMYYNRPHIEIRYKVDLGYRIEDQNVFLFEIRPNHIRPKEKIEHPLAKTTYLKSKSLWKIYWLVCQPLNSLANILVLFFLYARQILQA